MTRLPQISALAQGGVPREFSAEATEFAGTEEPKSGPIFAPVRSTTTTSNTGRAAGDHGDCAAGQKGVGTDPQNQGNRC